MSQKASFIATLAVPFLAVGAGCSAAISAINRTIEKLDDDTRKKIDSLIKANDNAITNTAQNLIIIKQNIINSVSNLENQFSRLSIENKLAQLVVLNNSSLKNFISAENISYMQNKKFSRNAFQKVINSASNKFKFESTKQVLKEATLVLNDAGFPDDIKAGLNKNSKGYVSKADKDGRGVVIKVNTTDEGSNVSLDLTGFSDGACHNVMDDLLNRLNEKLKISDQKRKNHYNRNGYQEQKKTTKKKNINKSAIRKKIVQKNQIIQNS